MNNEDDTRNGADHQANGGEHADNHTPPRGATVQLNTRPERHLLRTTGSSSYLDVVVRVAASPNRSQPKRPPVHVALVIDRSGSMSGDKVRTAKRAALSVLDGLSEQDTAAVVIFDDRIDVVQAEAPVTPLVKAHVAAELSGIDARGSTALHEGWLVGCQAIAAAAAQSQGETPPTGPRRCFLLTDGQANVGLSQPEALAQAAAQVREAAQVSTSTFGIGADYNEDLLGPMAVSGGGEFYHLRTPQEIATTFVAELEQMLGTVARDAHLEIEATPGMVVELVSTYAWRSGALDKAGAGRWEITVGDLVGGEERHVVMSLNFPAGHAATGTPTVQVRLTWEDEAGSHVTDWQRCTFRYAETDAEYDAEMRDETVLHYAAQHLSDRAQREAIGARKRGDLQSAQTTARAALSRLGALGLRDGDHIRSQEVQSLEAMNVELAAPMPDALILKERYYQSQLRARSKSDLRERQRRLGRTGDVASPKDDAAPSDPTTGTPPPTGS